MKSKIIALAATAIAAVLTVGVAPAQSTPLPSLAGPPAASGQTLTHANGYSITLPSDWLVATDIEGADYMMGNPDLSIICQAFSIPNLSMQVTDEQIRAELGANDLGPDFYTKLIFSGAPDLVYESTGPQANHPSGWPFQRAVATLTVDGKKHHAFAYVTFKAKTLFGGFCLTSSDVVASGRDTINGVIDSVRIRK